MLHNLPSVAVFRLIATVHSTAHVYTFILFSIIQQRTTVDIMKNIFNLNISLLSYELLSSQENYIHSSFLFSRPCTILSLFDVTLSIAITIATLPDDDTMKRISI